MSEVEKAQNAILKHDPSTLVKDVVWGSDSIGLGEDKDKNHIWWVYLNDGSRITVMDRVTGYIGSPRDIESGFTEYGPTPEDRKFWLASGNFDIRNYLNVDLLAAVELIKQSANTCRGD